MSPVVAVRNGHLCQSCKDEQVVERHRIVMRTAPLGLAYPDQLGIYAYHDVQFYCNQCQILTRNSYTSDDDIIASLYISRSPVHIKGIANALYISSISVNNGYRRMRLGTLLVYTALRLYPKTKVLLSSRFYHEAVSFWRRFGRLASGGDNLTLRRKLNTDLAIQWKSVEKKFIPAVRLYNL